MELIIAVGSAIVFLLGVLTLLNEWSEHAKKPLRWSALTRERRALLVLLASVSLGVVGGGASWFVSRRNARIRNLLFNLEVLLAQLDGLVAVALVHGNVKNSLGSIRILVDHIGKYGFKAASILSGLEKDLSAEEYEDLKSGGMIITVGLEALESPAAPESEQAQMEALVRMQAGIRLARSHVRQLIDERTV